MSCEFGVAVHFLEAYEIRVECGDAAVRETHHGYLLRVDQGMIRKRPVSAERVGKARDCRKLGDIGHGVKAAGCKAVDGERGKTRTVKHAHPFAYWRARHSDSVGAVHQDYRGLLWAGFGNL